MRVLRDLDQVVREELVRSAPGAVLDSAVRDTEFTTTNTGFGSVAAASLVAGLELEIEGTGRPVDLEFASIFRHSTGTSGWVGAYLVTSIDAGADGVATIPRAWALPSGTNDAAGNRGFVAPWRNIPTVEGTLYAFKVGIYGPAGTSRLPVTGQPITFQARSH